MNDPERLEGCRREQVGYLRELKEIDAELSRIGILTFFMVTRLDIKVVRTMMNSATKQRLLLYSVMKDLKVYRVDPEYDKAFRGDIAGLRRRCEQVYRICQKDLRLTPHWPYFEQVGFEKLLDFRWVEDISDNTTNLDHLLPDLEA